MIRPRIPVVFLILLLGSIACAEDAQTNGAPSKIFTVKPADNGQALINPSMGWELYFYSDFTDNYGSKLDPSDTVDDFPGISTVYMRIPWAMLEPSEGKFNWAEFDTPAQRWIAKGKKIALRVTCSESMVRYATPEWVQKAGAKGKNFDVGAGPRDDGPMWDPIFDDPIFLAKLENFLKALAARYDGNPNVAYIDIGSFGLWGEGHTVASSHLTQAETLPIIKKHIDLHASIFKHTQLAISDDIAGDHTPGAHLPETDYALSKGVTLRDDSIMVWPPPKAWYHAEMAQAFWPKTPVILEHDHLISSQIRKAWNGDRLLQAVEEYHASYLSIHWFPREYLETNRATVEKINRRIGYRLQLREMSWPKEVAIGKPFDVKSTWANAGVAPCYPVGFATLTFKDAKGGIVSVLADETLDMRSLEVGPAKKAPTKSQTSTFTVGLFAPATKPGTYDVFVSVGQRDGTPKIALPLDDDDGQRRYKIGKVTIVPG